MNAERQLLAALLALTFVTGIVDAVSFLGLGHVFTANMTGNVVLLGFAVAGASGLSVARSSLSLLGFLAGAVLGGLLGLVMINATRRRRIFTAGALEAVLLFGAAGVSTGLDALLLMFAGAAAGMLLLRHGLVLPLVVSGVCVLTASAYAGVAALSEPSPGAR